MKSKERPSLGHNRTGIGTSPDASQQMMQGTAEFMPLDPAADEEQIALVREAYV